MGKRRVKKKNTVVIKAKEVYSLGEHQLVTVTGDEAWLKLKSVGKNVDKESGLITITKKGIISDVFLNKNGTISTINEVDLRQLESLVKKAKKQLKYFKNLDKKRAKENKPKLSKVFFVHLNPEISFLIKY